MLTCVNEVHRFFFFYSEALDIHDNIFQTNDSCQSLFDAQVDNSTPLHGAALPLNISLIEIPATTRLS